MCLGDSAPLHVSNRNFVSLLSTTFSGQQCPEDKIKYEYAMTTERDIRNQIRYAEKQGVEKGLAQGMEQGKEQGAIEIARRMQDGKMAIEKIVEFTGLTEEQVRAL